MQAKGTRMYRVRAVAEMFDVSVSTIYRAIESGQLTALKIGIGKGTVRIPEYALAAFEEACAEAAYSAYVVDGANAEAGDEGALTPAQADGRACVVCSYRFEDGTAEAPHQPVGFSETGAQMFACTVHVVQAISQFGEVA